jgi:hypothetical protein
MALYEDYLNQNNLYSRPASMMSNVNDYLGANKASLPMNQDSLGSLMGKPMLGGLDGNGGGGGYIPDITDDDDPGPKDPKDPPKDPTGSTGNNSLLTKFISDLGALDENQQGLLLDFITGGGESGDAARGVSPEEYAQLFNVSSDYTGRFQGFPQLTSISDDISNVFNYRSEQRGFEQRAVQQAQIAQGGKFQGGAGFSGFGRGRGVSNALQRRQMQDTLRQRQGAVDEAAAGKYGTLLSSLQSAIRSGFSTAGTIHDENPEAVWGFERSGQFTPTGWTEDDGHGPFTDKYGTIWEYSGGQWRQQDR